MPKRPKIYMFDYAPHLREEWDYEKNVGIDPEKLTHASRVKVWWKPKGCTHSYDSPVLYKTVQKVKCPMCYSRVIVTGVNDLRTLNPELESQLVDRIIGDKISPRVRKKLLWECNLGHQWWATVNNRTSNNSGCPGCSGRIIVVGRNDLLSCFPDIAAELQDPRLGTLLSKSSSKQIDWVCVAGHKWRSTVTNRTGGGTGCPVCFNKTSKIEGKLRELLGEKYILEGGDHTHRVPVKWRKSGSMQVDVHFIHNGSDVIVEYDGGYWHHGKADADIEKTELLLDNGYTVIRIREQSSKYPLPALDLKHNNLLQLKVLFSRRKDILDAAVESIETWLEEKNE